MPDRDVKTILDQIYFQYAKIIAKSAFNLPDGVTAKHTCYGFIKSTYKDLKSGAKSWSDILREDWQTIEEEKKCIYCGATEDLHKEHIIPKSIRINKRCADCDKIQGIHNQIWACKSCNSSKGAMGLYHFYQKKLPDQKKFFDFIPPLAEKKYLKNIYYCHECAGTLDKVIENISALDIDSPIER